MDWAYYCCVNLDSMGQVWNLTLGEIRQTIQGCELPELPEHWATADSGMRLNTYIPAVDRLAARFGEEKPVSEICSAVCEKLNGETIGPIRREESKKSWWTRLNAREKEICEIVDSYYELFDLYKGLFLLEQRGPVTAPLRSIICHCYFPDYLKYFTSVRNHRRYDGYNRKNYIRKIQPRGMELIQEHIVDWYNFENQCEYPLLMDARKWKEQWDVLGALPDFWDTFTITEVGPTRDASCDFAFEIKLAEDRNKYIREARVHDPHETIQRYIENRRPTKLKVTTPEYSRYAAEQLRKIGDIAEYALQNNLSLVQYLI